MGKMFTSQIRHTVKDPNNSEISSLSSDMVGFWKSYTIYAAVKLKVPDFLPGTIQHVSAATNIPVNKLERLMRALWELNIVSPSEKIWKLTAKGQPLTPTARAPMAAAAIMWIEANQDLWSHLLKELQVEKDNVIPYFKSLKDRSQMLEYYH